MLEMRPNCELCDADLPAAKQDAFICSLECTFCSDCNDAKLENKCLIAESSLHTVLAALANGLKNILPLQNEF